MASSSDKSSEPFLNPSVLRGSRHRRVFVGGSYSGARRRQLDELVAVVEGESFAPVVAYWYKLENPDIDIHDETLALLHMCSLAIFELSEASGALMEIERVLDYGLVTLVLYNNPDGTSYLPTRMLSSFIERRSELITVTGYALPKHAVSRARTWLRRQESRIKQSGTRSSKP